MTPGPRPPTPLPNSSYTLPFRWPNYLIPTIPFLRNIPKLSFLHSAPTTLVVSPVANTVQSQPESDPDDDDDDDTASSSSYDSAITSLQSDQGFSDQANIFQSTSTSTSQDLNPPPPLTQNYLYGSTSILKCRRCQTDICFSESVISKGFNGRYGRAYLCNPIPAHTHTLAKPTTRQLATGTHLVADISCSVCLNTLGWKYVSATDPYQQYKVGKFILETKRVVKVAHWQSHQVQAKPIPLALTTTISKPPGAAATNLGNTLTPSITSWDLDIDTGKRELAQAEEWGDVNSEDEDELEDMFLGKWTPKLAAKRRKLWEKEASVRTRTDEGGLPIRLDVSFLLEPRLLSHFHGRHCFYGIRLYLPL
ncbi:yippee zinc-binding/DNA-binding /Mis18, centromere assembly-domain-containing protein [Tirmania nivea]|nr:yippee zinc-binding/DNA-binding /Mis18, centromere assembly-domain-containing protein [Tirmania nivea]